jgi:hypothetical protein
LKNWITLADKLKDLSKKSIDDSNLKMKKSINEIDLLSENINDGMKEEANTLLEEINMIKD